MKQIQKVSDITAQDIAEYIRLGELDTDDINYLDTICNVAKKYISSQTGITDLDEFSDFVIVVFVLCQDMYDNRSMYVDNDNLNKVVETILGMHRRNLL